MKFSFTYLFIADLYFRTNVWNATLMRNIGSEGVFKVKIVLSEFFFVHIDDVIEGRIVWMYLFLKNVPLIRKFLKGNPEKYTWMHIRGSAGKI